MSTPCLILSSLAEKSIEIGLAGKVFISVLGVIGGCLIICYVIIRVLNLPIKVYLPPVLFANTGNMGLPLVLFAFGDAGFNIEILYMISVTIVQYTIGIMILSFDESPHDVFKLPLIYSAALGVALNVSMDNAYNGWKSYKSFRRSEHSNNDFRAGI